MAYNRHAALVGDTLVGVTPAGSMVYNQHPSLAGGGLVTIAVTGGMQHTPAGGGSELPRKEFHLSLALWTGL
jgi:hypothetical protein